MVINRGRVFKNLNICFYSMQFNGCSRNTEYTEKNVFRIKKHILRALQYV